MARHKANFTHIGVPVSELARSQAFYERWAGMKAADKFDSPGGVKAVKLVGTGSSFVLSLFEAPSLAPLTGLSHLGFDCDSKKTVDAIAADAKKSGVPAVGPVDSGGELGYQLFITDPDGNNLEFSFGQKVGIVA